MPDATGLELIAQRVREGVGDEAVVDTVFYRSRATLDVAPGSVRDVIAYLRDGDEDPWERLMSVHGVDDPRVPTVVDLHATANFQEREVLDMFGVVFEGHPDMRRILMPEDYEGYPQRRDFPMGGEPVIYTFNEPKLPRWYD